MTALRLRRLVFLLVACLALGVAGCGEDEEGGGSGDQAPLTSPGGDTEAEPTGAETTGSETTQGTETTDTTGGGGIPTPDTSDSADACRQQIEGAPQLSDEARDELQRLCDEAESGDPDQAREAAREACERIVDETTPEALREQARALCAGQG